MQRHKHEKTDRGKEAIKITVVSAIANLSLSAGKFIIGLFANSSALIADAAHSLSDLTTDFVVVAGVKLAEKPADETHRYGHGKIETLATAIVGILLILAAAEIMSSSIKSIYEVWSNSKHIAAPKIWALYAAAISVLVKEVLYRYTKRTGEKIQSTAVIANAWHHRSDALSSIAAFIGISGAIVGGEKFYVLDPAAGVLVSVFVIKVGAQFVWDSIKELLEEAPNKETMESIHKIICSAYDASNAHNIRARKVGKNLVIEFHIEVDPNISVKQAHDIATRIENKLKDKFGKDTIITTHIEPMKTKE